MKSHRRILGTLLTVAFVAAMLGLPFHARAAAPLPKNPQSGSVGLEGTISSPPPTQAATISTPVSGRNFNSLPVSVNGLCPSGTLVKLFSNNIFIGAVTCSNGSYSLQADLFSGANELVARVFDDLDQAGPDSNKVTVTFVDPTIGAFDNRVSLTSTYARKGANPGDTLTWPISLSGGVGPYALSIDWGDGKPITLKSVPFTGTYNFDHVYDTAGVYRVIVKVSDSTGSAAYLQLIGVANGAIASSGTSTKGGTGSGTTSVTQTKYSPIPAIASVPLIFASFWLGQRYQLQALRRRIEQSTREYGD